jgi:succinate dehydrogenase/fumarate reductase flavoprotein subunit
VLVVGSGAGGLSAAISAALRGLKVLVVEKHHLLGGSTARSGGMIWAPCNPLSQAEGVEDTLANARLYIQYEAGEFFDGSRVDAYLENAPKMIEEYRSKTSAMRFVRADAAADNHLNLPGSLARGRTITVPAFDVRELGRLTRNLAPPIDELTFLGMQIQPGRELNNFFGAFSSWKSFAFVAGRLTRHAWDLLRHGRTLRLANGNALAARLVRSASDLGVEFALSSPVSELVTESGQVTGAVIETPGGRVHVRARRGVVLACGGFPHDPQRRRTHSPVGALGGGTYALAPKTNTGDGLTMGERAGGVVERSLPNTISWTPVSRVMRRDGSTGLFPHSFDRNKPGFIAVTRSGCRFISEGAIGNDFVRAMVRDCQGQVPEAFLITDHHTIRRYGLGVVRPWPVPLGVHIRSGYLVRRPTLEELARALGIEESGLLQTVAQFNVNAEKGLDPDFGRGQNALEQRNGDPKVKPNPCLAPINRPFYYAVRVYPGDFSTLAGLRTDPHARVLNPVGRPIPGLYAVGNDASTMFAGNSPAGGCTLGPAMTFGFIAGKHMAESRAAIGSDSLRQGS